MINADVIVTMNILDEEARVDSQPGVRNVVVFPSGHEVIEWLSPVDALSRAQELLTAAQTALYRRGFS